jgi:MerR family redox-sensitive transcriptional activator SoxR
MQVFSIGEIAKQVRVATSTIRYYESIGLLPPAKRVSGKRRYDATVLEKLGVIRLAQDAGLTIAEIQTLLYDFPTDTPPSERWQSLATKKIVELDALLNRVQAMKSLLEQTLQCHCATLEECATVDSGAEGGAVGVKQNC